MRACVRVYVCVCVCSVCTDQCHVYQRYEYIAFTFLLYITLFVNCIRVTVSYMCIGLLSIAFRLICIT